MDTPENIENMWMPDGLSFADLSSNPKDDDEDVFLEFFSEEDFGKWKM